MAGLFMRAKMRATKIERADRVDFVRMIPVAGIDTFAPEGIDTHNSYASFNPVGQLALRINSPELVGAIAPHQTFGVFFVEWDDTLTERFESIDVLLLAACVLDTSKLDALVKSATLAIRRQVVSTLSPALPTTRWSFVVSFPIAPATGCSAPLIPTACADSTRSRDKRRTGRHPARVAHVILL